MKDVGYGKSVGTKSEQRDDSRYNIRGPGSREKPLTFHGKGENHAAVS